MAKYEVEPSDGKNNFSTWQSTIKDILLQQGLIKELYGKDKKPASMIDYQWEELEMLAVNTIHSSLAPEIKQSVLNETSLALWKKIGEYPHVKVPC